MCQSCVVSKLGAILFYSGIHFKPRKLSTNYKKKFEDLNWHIPLKINEFASLALTGRYPEFIYLIIYLSKIHTCHRDLKQK